MVTRKVSIVITIISRHRLASWSGGQCVKERSLAKIRLRKERVLQKVSVDRRTWIMGEQITLTLGRVRKREEEEVKGEKEQERKREEREGETRLKRRNRHWKCSRWKSFEIVFTPVCSFTNFPAEGESSGVSHSSQVNRSLPSRLDPVS